MTEVICLYGLDSGTVDPEFKEWLEESKKHYLVYLEEDLTVLHVPLLNHPQVKVCVFSAINEEEIFKQVAWDFVFASFSYRPNPAYEGKKKQREQEVFEKLSFLQSGVTLVSSDYADLGVKVLSNFRKNSQFLSQAARGAALTNRFQKTPAIICGAGPSLNEAIPLLKKLEDRALIFAGGATLSILAQHQVAIHFGAGVDPHFSEERFWGQSDFELPFFYQDRMSHSLLEKVHGPKLWVPDGGGYLLERHLSESLGLSDHPFDGGWTVGNLCTALSCLLGCDPIILVGMDLCVKDGKAYAEGIESKQEEWITVQTSDGEIVHSKRDWVMSAGWMETWARMHPHTRFIDATDGGIGFKGIEKLSLEDATERYCTESFDLKGKVHSMLCSIEKTKVPSEAVSIFWDQVDESLKRCQLKCAGLLELIAASYPDSPFDKGPFIVYQIELEEELYFAKVLEPIWNVWRHFFKREIGAVMEDRMGEWMNKLLFFQRIMDGQI